LYPSRPLTPTHRVMDPIILNLHTDTDTTDRGTTDTMDPITTVPPITAITDTATTEPITPTVTANLS